MKELATHIIGMVDHTLNEVLTGRSYVGVDELSNYLLDIRLECSSRLEPESTQEGEDEQLQEELAALVGTDPGIG